MSLKLRSKIRSRGFSLVEALPAIVVVVLCILAMLAIVPFGFTSVQANSLEVQAVAVAQQYLDDERNALLQKSVAMPTATTAPIDAGQSYVGATTSNYGNFNVAPDGCVTKQYTGTSANVFACSVSVTWTESGASRSVTVLSYVAK